MPSLLVAANWGSTPEHSFIRDEQVAEPAPLVAGDVDRDGLLDVEEDELARRFAPIVILDARDANRPASIPWFVARTEFLPKAIGTPLLASLPSPRLDSAVVPAAARAGSADLQDWTTYVHAFPRRDGGINVQYWFFYAYNDGPLLFDHESDWEHVTVRLSANRTPLGVYFARHQNDHPGEYRAWSRVRREGEHVLVLSALGTHGSYADQQDLSWFERASSCTSIEGCSDPVWRTWEGGGLEHVGERRRPRASRAPLVYGSRWGQVNWLPGTSAPYGPLYHRGFCSDGFESCGANVPIPLQFVTVGE